MLGLESPIDPGFDAARIKTDGVLAWASLNSSKPGRDPSAAGVGQTWVINANRAWSREHIEDAEGDVSRQMLDAFRRFTGERLADPPIVKARRWRYALSKRPLGGASPVSRGLGVAVAGDWLLGQSIEDAFRSGNAAAGRIVELADRRAAAEALPS
jgi:predicted NAD/FAD-dependent oxidoreductase